MICLYDLLGGGSSWPQGVSLDITGIPGVSSLSVDCECQCTTIESVPLNYEICLNSDSSVSSSSIPVLWSFGTSSTGYGSGKEIYGSIGSCVTVKDGVTFGTTNVLNVNDDSTCDQFKGKGKAKKGPESDKKTKTPKPKPGPGQVVLPLQINNKERVADACRRNAKAQTSCNSLPASLSHPVLLVTSANGNGNNNGMEIISSSSLLSFETHHQYLLVPKNGEFTFRSIGYSTQSDSEISWKFCDVDGTLGDSATFTMSDGKCSVTETTNRLTCSNPFIILQDPTVLDTTQEGDDSSRLFGSFTFLTIAGIVGIMTIGLVLSKTFKVHGTSSTVSHDHEFSRLDATESGHKMNVVELEPIPSRLNSPPTL